MNGYITLALIAVTSLVSWQAWERPQLLNRLILWPPAVERQQQYDRLLTHGFIHADGMHLIFNMVTLYSFGHDPFVVTSAKVNVGTPQLSVAVATAKSRVPKHSSKSLSRVTLAGQVTIGARVSATVIVVRQLEVSPFTPIAV